LLIDVVSTGSGYLVAGVVGLAASVLLAACGGGSAAVVGASTTGADSAFALSKCMRSHGVSSFPDPTAGPGGAGLTILRSPGQSGLTVDGINFSGPAFETAAAACKRYLPGGQGGPPSLTAAEKQQLLAMAQCMRTHGVPSFPDPSFSGSIAGKHLPSQIDPQSPAFQHAISVCGHKGRLALRVSVNGRKS
jgi:hypothetical protein